jgi:hypothetical protein
METVSVERRHHHLSRSSVRAVGRAYRGVTRDALICGQQKPASKAQDPKAQEPRIPRKGSAAGDPAALKSGFPAMSLLPESQPTRCDKLRRIQPKWSPLDAVPTLHRDQILPFPEWCQFNRFSARTGRRILSSVNCLVMQLPRNRIGIRIANNARWQRSRGRA